MTASINDKIGLARFFGELLQTALTPDEFAELVERNAMHDPLSSVCYSHDYCDANMVMAEAWENMFGSAFPMLDDNDNGGPTDTDLELWNDAWAIARGANFFKP